MCGKPDAQASPVAARPRNNTRLIGDNNRAPAPQILNNLARLVMMRPMIKTSPLIGLAVCASLLGTASSAQCFADYKAKQDDPLRLHYGVMEVRSGCNVAAAEPEMRARLQSAGWTLLNVLTVFGREGLDQRRDSAGHYYLRF